jgi:hypothetical protein
MAVAKPPPEPPPAPHAWTVAVVTSEGTVHVVFALAASKR